MSYKNNAISSDDPKAIEKLTEKLQKCEKEQEFMKNVNAYYKKNGTTKGCDGISDELAAKLDTRVQEAYSWDKQPFPSYLRTCRTRRLGGPAGCFNCCNRSCGNSRKPFRYLHFR